MDHVEEKMVLEGVRLNLPKGVPVNIHENLWLGFVSWKTLQKVYEAIGWLG